MIKIPTIDSKICHANQTWKDLIDVFCSNPSTIEISMNGEGPCLTTVGLYEILDILCDKFSYPKHCINIITANMLEFHNEYQIVKQHQAYELLAVQDMPVMSYSKQFNTEFKHFGSFIGHANKHRLQIASFLWNNFKDQTLQTFHCKITDDYHREFLGIEDLLHSGVGPAEIRSALDLIIAAPLVIDDVMSSPILFPSSLNIAKVYTNFFVEVVNLTYFTGNTFYVDEKIWRPIAMRTPFIVQGPKDTIRNLRKLGFKTFDQWWDEGYSEDIELCQNQGIKDVIKTLSLKTTHQLYKMYLEMQPILEHNNTCLKNLKQKDFQRIFG
jgi:hypothetical protein